MYFRGLKGMQILYLGVLLALLGMVFKVYALGLVPVVAWGIFKLDSENKKL